MNFLGPLTQQKLKRLDQNLPSTIYGSDKYDSPFYSPKNAFE